MTQGSLFKTPVGLVALLFALNSATADSVAIDIANRLEAIASRTPPIALQVESVLVLAESSTGAREQNQAQPTLHVARDGWAMVLGDVRMWRESDPPALSGRTHADIAWFDLDVRGARGKRSVFRYSTNSRAQSSDFAIGLLLQSFESFSSVGGAKYRLTTLQDVMRTRADQVHVWIDGDETVVEYLYRTADGRVAALEPCQIRLAKRCDVEVVTSISTRMYRAVAGEKETQPELVSFAVLRASDFERHGGAVLPKSVTRSGSNKLPDQTLTGVQEWRVTEIVDLPQGTLERLMDRVKTLAAGDMLRDAAANIRLVSGGREFELDGIPYRARLALDDLEPASLAGVLRDAIRMDSAATQSPRARAAVDLNLGSALIDGKEVRLIGTLDIGSIIGSRAVKAIRPSCGCADAKLSSVDPSHAAIDVAMRIHEPGVRAADVFVLREDGTSKNYSIRGTGLSALKVVVGSHPTRTENGGFIDLIALTNGPTPPNPTIDDGRTMTFDGWSPIGGTTPQHAQSHFVGRLQFPSAPPGGREAIHVGNSALSWAWTNEELK